MRARVATSAYGETMDERVGRVPDEHVVSAATLEELASSPVPLTARMVGWITTADLAAVPEVEPLTALSLEGLTRLSDSPSEDALGSVPRDVVASTCRQAAVSGYLLGRVLLGTHDRPVGLPAPQRSDDLFAPIGAMELSFEFPRLWAEVTIDAINHAVEGSGFADPEPDEPIGSTTALAFDQAVAIALIEHDRWRGRTPG
jgi:hypothetical protein